MSNVVVTEGQTCRGTGYLREAPSEAGCGTAAGAGTTASGVLKQGGQG